MAARVATAAARDFGDVLDGDSDDDLAGGKPISIKQGIFDAAKPPQQLSIGPATTSMSMPTSVRSPITASNQRRASYESAATQSQLSPTVIGDNAKPPSSHRRRVHTTIPVVGIANALSSDDEDDFASASPGQLATTPRSRVPSFVQMNSLKDGRSTKLGALVNLEDQGMGAPSPTKLGTSGSGSASGGGSGSSGILRLRELTVPPGTEARVGISCTNLPPILSEPLLGGTAGVLVSSLVAGGRAASAGLLVGDVIVRVNDQPASSHAQVIAEVDKAATATMPLQLGVLDSSFAVALDKSAGTIGVICQEAIPRPTASRGKPATAVVSGGVLVAGWRADSLGEAQGLFPGLLLLSVNGVVPTDHAHAVKLIDSASDPLVTFVFRRMAAAVTLRLRDGGDTGLVVRDHELGLGAVVSAVREGSPAAAAGLRSGDVVLAVAKEVIRTAERATELLQSASGSELHLVKRL